MLGPCPNPSLASGMIKQLNICTLFPEANHVIFQGWRSCEDDIKQGLQKLKVPCKGQALLLLLLFRTVLLVISACTTMLHNHMLRRAMFCPAFAELHQPIYLDAPPKQSQSDLSQSSIFRSPSLRHPLGFQ